MEGNPTQEPIDRSRGLLEGMNEAGTPSPQIASIICPRTLHTLIHRQHSIQYQIYYPVRQSVRLQDTGNSGQWLNQQSAD